MLLNLNIIECQFDLILETNMHIIRDYQKSIMNSDKEETSQNTDIRFDT